MKYKQNRSVDTNDPSVWWFAIVTFMVQQQRISPIHSHRHTIHCACTVSVIAIALCAICLNSTCKIVGCWVMLVYAHIILSNATNTCARATPSTLWIELLSRSIRTMCVVGYAVGLFGSRIYGGENGKKIINKVSVCCTGTERFMYTSAEHQSSQKCCHEQMRFVVYAV